MELDTFREGGYGTADQNFPLSTETAASCFQSYLSGQTLTQIQKNTGGLSLGQVVDAAVSNNWLQEKKDYVAFLAEKAKEELAKISLESAQFLGQVLAAHHACVGPKVRKAIQTGKRNDLDQAIDGPFLGQYGKTLSLLMQVSGQDRIHRNINENKTSPADPVPAPVPAPVPEASPPVVEATVVAPKKPLTIADLARAKRQLEEANKSPF